MTSAVRTPLAVGESIAHRVSQAVIVLQRGEHTYTVTVLRGSTGARVDQLCSAHATEADARAAARNAYRAFHAGATVDQVIDDLNGAVTAGLATAMRRRDARRVAELNRVGDLLDSDADRALLADLRRTLAGPQDLSGFGRIRARHAAAVAAERTEVAGQAALFGALAS